jgi:hypothetical protein
MKLHLEILPEAQQRVWAELRDIPAQFTLYGGTAIALQLGHRQSIDFDFFSSEAFDPATLYRRLPLLQNAHILQQDKNTLTCLLDRGGNVQISFFFPPSLKCLQPTHFITENGIKIASLLDLAGTKAEVVQRRAEIKDYLDLDALMTSGITLPMAIAAACKIWGERFNPQITLKALSYFGDGDVATLSEEVKQRIVKAVKSTHLDNLPTL